MLLPWATAKPRRAGPLALALLAFVGGLMAVTVYTVVAGHRALHRAAREAAQAGQLGFAIRTLDPAASRRSLANVNAVAPRMEYTSGAFAGRELFLAGPYGLTRVGAGGAVSLHWRAGVELPAAEITSLATGRLRGGTERLIFAGTAGAGLLMVGDADGVAPTLRQVLPAAEASRDMTALLSLPTGELLLGMRHGGLLQYDGARLRQVSLPLEGVDSTRLDVTALAPVDAAAFLLGTRNAGAYLVSGGTVRHVGTAEGLPDNDVESIAVADGHAFVGTPLGTAEIELAAEPLAAQRTLAPGVFGHRLLVEGNSLLIGTLEGGVVQVPLSQRPALRRASIAAALPAASTGRVDALLPDGARVYALRDGEVVRHDNGAWPAVLPDGPAALTSRNISALAFAPDGTLYVGFFDRGVDLLSPEGRLRHMEDDHLFCINRLRLDPLRRTMAAATADGLVLFDATGLPRQTLARRDGLISDHVTDVAFTSGGGMALATSAGVTFLGTGGAESLYAFQGLVNNHVYALATEGTGGTERVIAGTLGGISVLRSRSVERSFTVNNSSLGHNWITALLPLPDGGTLVGTYGAGLQTLDAEGRFMAAPMPAGVPGDLVVNPNALLASPTHLYAGTLGHGMLVYSLARRRWVMWTAGLPSLNVTSFAAREGELYIGTDNGLVRLPEATLP